MARTPATLQPSASKHAATREAIMPDRGDDQPTPERASVGTHSALEQVTSRALVGLGEEFDFAGPDMLWQFEQEMAPRTAAERLFLNHMFYMHLRITKLCLQASEEKRPDRAKALNAAVDSAVNTYRRQMETWHRLRHPRATQFLSAQQLNVAEQQVVSGGG